jgi:hypothetical protein
MNRYYRIDTRRLRFAELWRISPGLGFLVGALKKILGVPLRVGTLVPWLDRLEVLPRGGLPPDVAGAVEPVASQWAALGFRRVLDYTVDMRDPGSRAFAAALLAPDGRAIAQVMFVEVRRGELVRRRVESNCAARFEDGRWCGVSSGRKRMDAPPEFCSANRPGSPPAQLYDLLQKAAAACSPSPPMAWREEEVEGVIVGINNLAVEFNVQRGVYVPAEAGGVVPPPIG